MASLMLGLDGGWMRNSQFRTEIVGDLALEELLLGIFFGMLVGIGCERGGEENRPRSNASRSQPIRS